MILLILFLSLFLCNFEIILDGKLSSMYLPRTFKQISLPLFLEGPTRQLKITNDINEKRKIYYAVSNLFIIKLNNLFFFLLIIR